MHASSTWLMKSLILTVLYLFKDTLHRWRERPSSALSRIFVVFFLSLCAMSFLANYVLSTQLIERKIRDNGGDTIVMRSIDKNGPDRTRLIRENIQKLCESNLFIVNELPEHALIGNKRIPIAEYSTRNLNGMQDLPLGTHPYLIALPQDSSIGEGLVSFNISGYTYTMPAIKIPPDHVLNRLKFYANGLVLVPEGSAGIDRLMTTSIVIVSVKEMTYANISKIHDTLDNIIRMDKSMAFISSTKQLLSELNIIMGNQTECRAGFSIGIAIIVGILLTTLSSMEFRENEYVYTLLKSFGVHPMLLLMTFIFENLFLIGISFVAAIYFFLESQKIILGEFFKLKNASLNFGDIEGDVLLLGTSLVLCVLASSIPIAVSAYREIGRVLK